MKYMTMSVITILRSTVFCIVFWVPFAIYITIMLPVAYFSSQQFVFKYIYRPCTRYLFLCLKYICGIKYGIDGKENLEYIKKHVPVIIGCNHQSTWETFVFSLLFDELSIVIKKELLDIPIAGTYFHRLGCIPIDRSSPINAIKSLLQSGKIAVARNENILIFPNGTRSSDDIHTEYKSGIFALYKNLNIPVIPVHVNSGKCWSRRSFVKLSGKIELEFKTPIEPGVSKDEFFNKFCKNMESGVHD